jgi:hypothetical protein
LPRAGKGVAELSRRIAKNVTRRQTGRPPLDPLNIHPRRLSLHPPSPATGSESAASDCGGGGGAGSGSDRSQPTRKLSLPTANLAQSRDAKHAASPHETDAGKDEERQGREAGEGRTTGGCRTNPQPGLETSRTATTLRSVGSDFRVERRRRPSSRPLPRPAPSWSASAPVKDHSCRRCPPSPSPLPGPSFAPATNPSRKGDAVSATVLYMSMSRSRRPTGPIRLPSYHSTPSHGGALRVR